MVFFQYIRTLLGDPATFDTGITDLEIHQSASGPVLYSINQTGGGVQAFGLTGAAPALLGQTFLTGSSEQAPYTLAVLDLGSGETLFPVGHLPGSLSGWSIGASGALTTAASWNADSGFSGNMETFASLEIGTTTYLFAHHYGTTGITAYQADVSLGLLYRGMTAAGSDTQASGAVQLATTSVGV